MTAAKKKALGRGLGALLDNPETNNPGKNEIYGNLVVGAISTITIDEIETNPYQPRNIFEEETLNELAGSIAEQGIITPITVRKISQNKFQLISGERRLRASKIAGLTEIPAYVRIASDQQMLEMAIVENLQREDLNAIEIALGFQRLIDECNLTQESLSKQVSKNRSTVTNYLRLLKLPAPIQLAISKSTITMGHARALISIDNTETQTRIFNLIIEKDLSVRQVEQIVRETSIIQKQAEEEAKTKISVPEKYIKLRDELKAKFNTSVDVKYKDNGKGSIVINFKSEEELENILNRFK